MKLEINAWNAAVLLVRGKYFKTTGFHAIKVQDRFVGHILHLVAVIHLKYVEHYSLVMKTSCSEKMKKMICLDQKRR